jgi:hypothetical protein
LATSSRNIDVIAEATGIIRNIEKNSIMKSDPHDSRSPSHVTWPTPGRSMLPGSRLSISHRSPA